MLYLDIGGADRDLIRHRIRGAADRLPGAAHLVNQGEHVEAGRQVHLEKTRAGTACNWHPPKMKYQPAYAGSYFIFNFLFDRRQVIHQGLHRSCGENFREKAVAFGEWSGWPRLNPYDLEVL